uniref:Uncharacterized protein n=1 Tax=Setaria digitata TaxID=48799 RepID=A0A915PH23_9BILA
MAHGTPPRPLRDERDIRDYDPNIIRLEFNRMLHANKVRKRSKQLKLWKVITLASYYQKLMASSRVEHMRQVTNYTRRLDATANQTDSVIETVKLLI